MDQSFFQNNPLFQDISPEKLQFLMNFANANKPTNTKDMAPFLMSAMQDAKQEGVSFSPDETDLIIEVLKQNMSPEEQRRADMIVALMKKNRR